MSLVSLRILTNHPNAEAYDFAASPTDIWYSEDYNRIRDAIQTGVTGIKTRDLEVVADADVTGDLTVAGELGVTGQLGVTGLAGFSSGIDVSGAVSVTGTVDGVDVSDHNHNGVGTNGPNIPLLAIEGASGAWSAHNHASDGSSQVVGAGIADGAVSFAKLDDDGGVFGITSSTIPRGDYVAAVRDRFLQFFTGSGTEFPMVGQWIGCERMSAVTNGNNQDTEPVLHGDSLGTSPAFYMFGRRFASGTTHACRFTFPVPSYVTSVTITPVFWVDVTPGTDLIMAVDIFNEVLGASIGGASARTTLTITAGAAPAAQIVTASGVSVVPSTSPAGREVVFARISRVSGAVGTDLFLAGAYVTYSFLYAAP